MSDIPANSTEGLADPAAGRTVNLVRVPCQIPTTNDDGLTPLAFVPALGVTVVAHAEGSVFAVPHDDAEPPRAIACVDHLRFDDIVSSDMVRHGMIVLPHDGQMRVLRYLGVGTASFTDRRVIGVFWASHIDDEDLPGMAAKLDYSNRAAVLWVASVDRDELDSADVRRERPGKPVEFLCVGDRAAVGGVFVGFVDPDSGHVGTPRSDELMEVASAVVEGDDILMPERYDAPSIGGLAGLAGAISPKLADALSGRSPQPASPKDVKRRLWPRRTR